VGKAYCGQRATLKLGLDVPGERWPPELGKQSVGNFRVEVFGVEQKAIHVKEASSDRRENPIKHQRKPERARARNLHFRSHGEWIEV
jgi:hypothetical protein